MKLREVREKLRDNSFKGSSCANLLLSFHNQLISHFQSAHDAHPIAHVFSTDDGAAHSLATFIHPDEIAVVIAQLNEGCRDDDAG